MVTVLLRVTDTVLSQEAVGEKGSGLRKKEAVCVSERDTSIVGEVLEVLDSGDVGERESVLEPEEVGVSEGVAVKENDAVSDGESVS